MITMLKKTRKKIHLNKTQKRETKVRDKQQSDALQIKNALTENTQMLTM